MSAISPRGGKADKALGSALWRRGVRYRRRTKLIGRPDMVLTSARVAIFVDGDFWHGRWLEERIARGDFKKNVDYWGPKLCRNAARDVEVTHCLEKQGWLVIRVWESEVKQDVESIAETILAIINERTVGTG